VSWHGRQLRRFTSRAFSVCRKIAARYLKAFNDTITNMALRFLTALAVSLFGLNVLSAPAAYVRPDALLHDPSREEWTMLHRFDGTLTREQFEARLRDVFDPFDGLTPFLQITDRGVVVFSSPKHSGIPVAKIAFARSIADSLAAKSTFRSSQAFRRALLARPLADLRVVIEPADIGGRWGAMEDRSSYYRGYGRIQEGDLNLLVAKLLRARLKQLGADVYVTREAAEPVCGLRLSDVNPVVPAVLTQRPYILPAAFHSRTKNVRKSDPAYRSIAAEILLTKNLETLARAEKARRAFTPDLTIVLQFDATPASCQAGLTDINRNIFFVEGAYTPKELANDPRQRLKLLTKLLQNVTPTETRVAVNIARRFKEATGFPPVLYGNTATTRAIAGSPYVVARNLAFNREHDGPVVVTEPYFMNQSVTLRRLLAGDYKGTKIIAGKPRPSIYREYADAVTKGLLDAYGKL
jgi:N-acetylmuramoyl-L-alanine amidase